MMMEMKAPATAGAACALVSGFGGHRIRFAPDDGLGAAPPDAGASAPPPSEPASIRDTLSAALKAQEAPQQPADASQSGSEQQAATTAADAEQAAQRARDEKGRFAPKDGQEGAQAAEVKPEGEQQADAAKPDAAKGTQPPASMKPEEREAFAKLPPEQQQFVARREAERERAFTKATQDIANERRLYGEMREPMTAVAHFAQRFNAHPGTVIQQWASVQEGLLRDPAGTIKTLAERFNVPLAQLAGSGQQQEEQYVDPQVAALQQELATVKQFVTSQQQQAEQAVRQRETAARQSVETSITEFASATDDLGQPKYPHFETLRPHMAALLETGAAKDLPDAYDQAMWSRPDLREQLLAAQREQAQRQQQEAQRQQAARAKSAAVSVAGAPGGVVPAPGPSDTGIRALLSQGAGLGR